jgi:hypothetical protein
MSSSAANIHDLLIREAFIDPIRTVIIVDDEYPTLDSLAAKEMGDAAGWNGDVEEVRRVRDILDFARKRSRPWLVDVHDGRKVTTEAEGGIATHLDHSDLLVLDYHLDGQEGNGDAAIDILRKLAVNDHFNLVIVYTKGYQGDLNKVIREIALSLTHSQSVFSLTPDELNSLKINLSQWEAENEGITEKLKAEISEETYLQLRSKHSSNPNGLLAMEEGKRILDYCKNCPKSIKIVPKQLATWLMAEKHQQLFKQFSDVNLGEVREGRFDDINWIRSDKLFITVLSKDCPPDQLETKLKDAIKISFPSPHRLLLMKMRAEIDQHGLLAEAEILSNKHVQAVWLNDFLNPEPIDTRAVIRNTINRHWEAFGDVLSQTVGAYSEQLRQFFVPMGIDEAMKKCGLNPADIKSDESLNRYNCFSSTKQIDRSHLTTGHVFRIDAGEEAGEPTFWICLSPACDMVPGQKTFTGLNDCITFVAVQLHKVAGNNALNNATNNAFLFLDIDGNVKTFSIYKDGSVTNNPEWEQKFVRNKGRFGDGNGLELASIREQGGELVPKWESAVVIAQLRSEYALNLLQRIGALLSRPGLGMNFKGR